MEKQKPKIAETMTRIIATWELDNYKQAATKSGFIINIVAKEGEEFTDKYFDPRDGMRASLGIVGFPGSWTKIGTIMPNTLGIHIEKPEGVSGKGYNAFFTALDAERKPSNIT